MDSPYPRGQVDVWGDISLIGHLSAIFELLSCSPPRNTYSPQAEILTQRKPPNCLYSGGG